MEKEIYARVALLEDHLWWYRGRRRVCQSILRDHLGPARDLQILDVGCGTGYNMGWLQRWGEVQGVEPSEDALKEVRRKGATAVRQAGAEALPYPDACFDLVSALDVIEHIDDDHLALREMRRVLRPGGWMLLYAPALPWLYDDHDRIVHHRRRYTSRELRQKVQAADLDIVFFSSANLLPLPVVVLGKLLYRRLPGRPHLEMGFPPWPVNSIMTLLVLLEADWLRHRPLPYGMSLACLARRPR